MAVTDLFAGMNQEETQQAVLAVLQSLASGDDGNAKDASVQAVVTGLQAVASQTTLAALLAKTTADPSTGTLQSQILAKMIASPASSAKQDSIITALGALATQTTAAAILAKLSADPSTATGVAAIVTALTSGVPHTDAQAILAAFTPLATQTTAAAMLAKMPTSPALDATVAGITTALTTGVPHTDSVAVQAALAPLATQTTAAAMLAKMPADPATKASVDAVTAALGSLGTQTTAAAILAKLPSSPALDATVAQIHTDIITGVQHTDLAAILAAFGPLATQTTLAAVLAKLSADPSTATGVAAVVTALGPLATQTTLAAVLAKLSADPSTATNQATEITALQAMASALGVGSTGLTKAEDTAVTSGDRGLATLLMRAMTTPVASTDAPGDYTFPIADAEGKQVMLTGSIPENTWQAAIQTTTAATTALKASAGAGLRNYLTDLEINMGSAVACVVTILDGATVIGRYSMPGTIGSTVSLSFRTPLRGSAATALNVTTSAAATVNTNARGYIGV